MARVTRIRSWISACDWPDRRPSVAGLEDEAQESQRLRIAQNVAQPVAKMHRRSGGRLNCLVDQSRAAQLQKTAMADLGFRRPAQQGQTIRSAQEFPQLFARPVPVDQEDQARAKKFEVGAAVVGILRLEPARSPDRNGAPAASTAVLLSFSHATPRGLSMS